MNRLYLGWLILCGQEMRGQQWEPHTAVPTVRRGSHYESFGIIFALEVKGTEGGSHRWLSKQNSSLQARTGPEYKSHPISSSSMALLSNKSALRPSWLRHLSLHSYLTQRWETKAFLPRPPGWGESTIQIPPELTNKKKQNKTCQKYTQDREQVPELQITCTSPFIQLFFSTLEEGMQWTTYSAGMINSPHLCKQPELCPVQCWSTHSSNTAQLTDFCYPGSYLTSGFIHKHFVAIPQSELLCSSRAAFL